MSDGDKVEGEERVGKAGCSGANAATNCHCTGSNVVGRAGCCGVNVAKGHDLGPGLVGDGHSGCVHDRKPDRDLP
jgi:hypothetical protein